MERNKMRYENSICDGCKNEFKQGEDIVVCPECGTPQHRKCYEENDECVNASLHETGFVWQGEVTTPVSEEKRKSKTKNNNLSALPAAMKIRRDHPFAKSAARSSPFSA